MTEENKKVFVEKLGSLIKRYTRTGKTIKEMFYVISLTAEYVIIRFFNGTEMKVNITGDSCLAIMNDIYNALV